MMLPVDSGNKISPVTYPPLLILSTYVIVLEESKPVTYILPHITAARAEREKMHGCG
jgi:hypothetical protein